ncbi:MAG: IS481 family transposase [Dehalococcoidales bacterium]|nr:IS481 family transposase [Dehalococcoidales bacterium]
MDKYIIERRARIRLAWFKKYEEIGNVTQVCKEFGISRKTFYKWWPHYAKEGLPGLKDHSKRPKNHPKTVPKEIAQLIAKLRHKSHYGLRRLAFYLERDYGIKLSVYGVYRVLVRAGLVKPRKHRPRKKPVYYQMNYPGQRVQVDAKYMPKIGLRDRPEPYKEYQYTAIDDCTRLRFVWVYQELCPANSVDFARRMLAFFPFPVEEVQTDHGTEFTYIFMPWVKKPHPFEEFLKEREIRHKLIPIASPKQNGKVERSHRTDEEEFYNQRGFRKPAKRRKELSRFLDFYNNRRPHSALGWMTPLEKLWSFPEYQGVTPSLKSVTHV